MRTLRLVALSEDGKNLVLAVEGGDPSDGERFVLPIDDRVRAAARGDARRLGQIDVDAGNTLPPRLIQARIRSGETPEQVAAASGTPVERILRFAHPVLQERERVAEQAREARVRLSEGNPTVPLHRFVNERLRLVGFDGPITSDWDAYRSDDGCWVVTGTWQSGDTSGATRWTLDLPSRTVTPHDAATTDFAEGTRLVRVVPDVPAGPPTAPPPRSRVLADLRDDAPGGPDAESDVPIADDVRGIGTAEGIPATLDTDVLLDEIAEHDTVVLRRGEDGEDEDPRAQVPAWEDIVFGVRRHR